MIREKVLLVAASFSTGLSGLLPIIRKMPDRDHGKAINPAREEQAPHHIPGSVRMASGLRDLPSAVGNRTEQGDILIIFLCLSAFVTGYATLLIDLPLVILASLGLVSLASLTLAACTVWCRFSHAAIAGKDPAPLTCPTAETKESCHTMNLPLAGEQDPAHIHECEAGTLEWYWIESPFVSIKIVRRGNQGFTYTVVEPDITPQEQTVLMETSGHLRKIIIYDNPEKPPVGRLDEETLSRIIREFHPRIAADRLAILVYYLRRDLSGFGPLEALMCDPALEDISCNGENLPVFVFHRTHGSLPTNILFRAGELDQFVLKLAQKANKQISLSNPMVDATLPGGSRVQITFSNVVSLRGSSFTIRKFRAEPMTPLDLIRTGTYSPEILAFLWLVIEHRKSLIIAGGTASGKTSTMNAVSLFIPLNAKIVSLEDTHEIQLPHKNWLATITRELTAAGVQGDIDLFSLLKSSMRQRPEYIIVGEVRGREAQTLFQAMNTGHATLSTLHAGSVREVINRLTHEPISVPPVMFTALDIVVSQSIFTYGNQRIRRCSAINEISVDQDSTIIPRTLFSWDSRSDTIHRVSQHSIVLDEIAAMRGWSTERINEELKKREEFLKLALDVPSPDIVDLANALHDLGE